MVIRANIVLLRSHAQDLKRARSGDLHTATRGAPGMNSQMSDEKREEEGLATRKRKCRVFELSPIHRLSTTLQTQSRRLQASRQPNLRFTTAMGPRGIYCGMTRVHTGKKKSHQRNRGRSAGPKDKGRRNTPGVVFETLRASRKRRKGV